MTPAISVVVPVLDMADTVGECLEALVSQSLSAAEREIIVVDNGSTDGTRDVVGRFPVTLIDEPAPGAPNARNCGVRASRADLVAFTDADCVPSRGWLRRLLGAFRQHDADVVAGPLAVLDPGQSIFARYSAALGQYDPARTLAHPRFPYATTGNLAMRRRLVTEAGLFDPAFPTFDAAELFWRLHRRTPPKAVIEPRAVVFYRTRQSIGAFIRQNYGYGQGLGLYCRRIAVDGGQPPGPAALLRHWGRRVGAVGQAARAGDTAVASMGLVGLHLLREAAMATGMLTATIGGHR
jgi:glycosyltransferase involved in cell wall biosynthesis